MRRGVYEARSVYMINMKWEGTCHPLVLVCFSCIYCIYAVKLKDMQRLHFWCISVYIQTKWP